MNINITHILIAVLDLIAVLITCRLIPWIKARTTNEQQQSLAAAIRVAVFAAEQIFGASHGPEKMDYALTYLRGKGFDVDSREVEAAILQYFNMPKIINSLLEESKPPEPLETPQE